MTGHERPTIAGWRDAWRDRRFRWVTCLSAAAFVATLVLVRRALVLVETRPGVELADAVLASFPAVDFNWITFASIYGATLLAVATLIRRPRRFLIALQAYVVLTNLRMLTLYLVPLDAPSSMIVLRDPVVETFVNSDHPITRDLFFSGHTATAFLFFLSAGRGWAKSALLAASVVIGLLVILQHVHYTADVVAAPFFALGAYRLTLWANGPGRLTPERRAEEDP